MSLNREKLRNLRDIKLEEQLYYYATKLDYALPFNNFSMSFYNFPFEPNVIKGTQNVCSKNSDQKQPYIVLLERNAVDISSKTFRKLMLSSVEKAFQVSLSNLHVNIEAVPECFVMCSDVERYSRIMNVEDKPGSFGCMLLSLPNELEFDESITTVKYKSKTQTWKLKPNSLVLMAGQKCTQGRHFFEVQSANGGRCAFLVFHLVWTDALQSGSFIKPDAFPTFIRAASMAREALEAWVKPRQQSPPAVSAASAADQRAQGQRSHRLALSPLVDAATTKFLCFPLLSNYSPYDLSMDRLKDADLLIAQALKSIDFLDVRFAILQCPSNGYKKLKARHSGELERRVSRKSVKKLPIIWSSSHQSYTNVTLERHLIWSITSRLENPTYFQPTFPSSSLASGFLSDEHAHELERQHLDDLEMQSSSSTSSVELDFWHRPHTKLHRRTSTSYPASDLSSEEERTLFCSNSFTQHAVLFVKPKWDRPSTTSFASFTDTLQHPSHISITDAIEAIKNRFTDIRDKIVADGTSPESYKFLSDFNRLVSSLVNTNEKIETRSCLEILDIATQTKQFDAGVNILKLFANNKHQCRNPDTALYLADFILVAGWEACSDPVLRMVDTSHSRFALLGKRLFHSGCLEGATQLADKLVEKLKPSFVFHRRYKLSLVSAITEFVCHLEAEPRTSSGRRRKMLIDYLKIQGFDLLIRVFIKAHRNSPENTVVPSLFTDNPGRIHATSL